MFFSSQEVNDRSHQLSTTLEDNDILRDLLLEGDFPSPHPNLLSGVIGVGVGVGLTPPLSKGSNSLNFNTLHGLIGPQSITKRNSRQFFHSNSSIDLSTPYISVDYDSHEIAFVNPLSRPPLSASNSGGLLPNMSSIISPPRVFIQEFARLQPPYVHESIPINGSSTSIFGRQSDSEKRPRPNNICPLASPLTVYDSKHKQQQRKLVLSTFSSGLPPPPLPHLTLPPFKRAKHATPTSTLPSNTTSPASVTEKSNGVLSGDNDHSFKCSTSYQMATEQRKQLRCSYPECPNLRRSAGFCNRHSGKICAVNGCQKSALSRGKCPEHGGGSRCKIENCSKFAQTRGLCKSHGGGRQCTVTGCTKNAHQNRLCRSHGGGKRCDYPGCPKWAQRSGYCCAHTKLPPQSAKVPAPIIKNSHTNYLIRDGESLSSLISPSLPLPLISPPSKFDEDCKRMDIWDLGRRHTTNVYS